MLEVADKDIQTFTIDHHGLVATLRKNLKIAEKSIKLLKVEPQRKVV